MSSSKDKAKGRLARLVSSAGRSPPPPAAAPTAATPAQVLKPAAAPFGRDPRLSRYISTRAFNRPEGVGVQEVLRALAEAVRSKDKNARQQLMGLLLRLFFYEELPPEAIQLLVPLFQAQGKDVRTLRSLYYLASTYVCSGSGGTPTLYDPSLVGKRPDEKALQAVLAEAWRLLDSSGLDPAVARSTFFLAAAAARSNSAARKQLAAQVQRAIAAADEQAAAGGPLAKTQRRSAATDWDLQHTAFATSRLAGTATGADEISRSFAVGVGSGDPVGARHALALGFDVALRDASFVVREMHQAVADAAQQYDAGGPGPLRTPGQGVNLEDGFARMHLARLCAAVVHSDQSATDVSRDGAPFWAMLCLLATRDPVDLVRFAAIDAMTGVLPSASASLGASKLGSSTREDTVARQRRGRAWRLLAAQGGQQVTVPGAGDKGAMKLVDVVGRLLLLALRKAGGSAARFCVAAGAVASLAESCMASQTAGTSRHGSSVDVDRVMAVLAGELGGLVEASLPAAQRCAVIEALLYLQAAGYATSFTPTKLVQAGGGESGTWTGGMQDALLTAVLKCAKAKPKEAATFLGYATAVVGIAPSGIDLAKVTELWDAAVAAGREGRAAVLAVVMDALGSPPPPSTQARGAGRVSEVTRAAREEDGWNAFVSTAAWWLGENANALCDEFCGRQLTPTAIPASIQAAAAAAAASAAAAAAAAGTQRAAAGSGSEEEGLAAALPAADESGDDAESGDGDGDAAAAAAAAATSAAELLQQFGGRSPTLSRIMLALQSLMLTAVWQLRLAAAQALSKIAVRSGEPYRLQCYSILAAACTAGGGGGGDALGLQSATRPTLSLLDKVYAAQVVLDQLWREHGEEVEAWPKEVVASLAKRNAELAQQAGRYVCAVPADRYSLLGYRATQVLATDEGAADYSFLKGSTEPEQVLQVGDRVGEQLAANKNREVDAILGSHASDEGGSLSTKLASASAFSGTSPTLDDRSKEIDRLLTGGAATAEPWGFASTGSGFNAFAEQTASAADTSSAFLPLPPTADSSAAATPRVGSGAARGGSGDWGGSASGMPRAASPSGSSVGGAGWFGEQAGGGDAGGTRAIGVGTVLHTFVGDYNQPEELSVFDGDKVEILEDTDGWMLVRDPSGREGLVPTSYLQVDVLYQQKLQSAAEAEAAAAAAAYQRKAAGTPTRAHRRGASVDWGQQNKEDLLDNIFSSYPANSMPSMPEEQPASFAQSPSFLGGGASSSSTAEASGAEYGGGPGTGGSLTPVPGQDSFTGVSGRTDSMWASQPLRQESLQRSSDAPFAEGPGGGVTRSATALSPSHRRSPSGASSSHRRTLSGASSGGVAGGGDPYDQGSMPGTPSRVEGPERGIVAGFVGELEGELSVEPGERVKVHSEVDGWARVIRLSDHRSGLVPTWAVGGE